MTPPLRYTWLLLLPTILPRTTFRSLSVGADSPRLLFLSALRSPIRDDTLCGRGEYDHDEGADVSPRSRVGTRHAGLSGLIHAPLRPIIYPSLTPTRTHSQSFDFRKW